MNEGFSEDAPGTPTNAQAKPEAPDRAGATPNMARARHPLAPDCDRAAVIPARVLETTAR